MLQNNNMLQLFRAKWHEGVWPFLALFGAQWNQTKCWGVGFSGVLG